MIPYIPENSQAFFLQCWYHSDTILFVLLLTPLVFPHGISVPLFLFHSDFPYLFNRVVPERGLEPLRISPSDFKSDASTDYATPTCSLTRLDCHTSLVVFSRSLVILSEPPRIGSSDHPGATRPLVLRERIELSSSDYKSPTLPLSYRSIHVEFWKEYG